MATITQDISALYPPSQANSVDFEALRDAFLAALANLVTELNTWSGQVSSLEGKASNWSALAQAALELAEAAAVAALSTSGVVRYSPTGSYDWPDVVLGDDGVGYRCLGVAVLGDDPVGSVTGNWMAITADPGTLVSLLLSGGIVPGWDWETQDSDGTAPPTNPQTPDQVVYSRGAERYRVAHTWGTAGELLTTVVSYSRDEGQTWEPVVVDDTCAITYDTNGAALSGAWS
jgi:hypothetical protein